MEPKRDAKTGLLLPDPGLYVFNPLGQPAFLLDALIVAAVLVMNLLCLLRMIVPEKRQK